MISRPEIERSSMNQTQSSTWDILIEAEGCDNDLGRHPPERKFDPVPT